MIQLKGCCCFCLRERSDGSFANRPAVGSSLILTYDRAIFPLGSFSWGLNEVEGTLAVENTAFTSREVATAP